MSTETVSTDVLVVGAGPAGLALGHRLMRLGLDVQVVDRAPVAGGHTRTVRRDGWRHEVGPHSFLGSAEHVFARAEELGLEAVDGRPATSRRYLYVDGRLRALPSGPFSALTTGVLPLSAKLRLMREPFVREPAEPAGETVRAFFNRRFGPKATERLVDAFVSGVYAGDISKLGMAATFPRMYQAAREHGSLIRGALAGRRKPRATPVRRGTFSFPGGMGDLTTALGEALGDRLHLGVEGRVGRDGSHWVLDRFRARRIAIAAPAHAASQLLADVAPELAEEMGRVDYAPVAVAHLLTRKADLPRPLDGFGFLIPRREGIRLLGCIWVSALYDVCDDEHAVLACFIGGAHDREAIGLTDEELLANVRRDLRTTMGLEAQPADFVLLRHPRAIPQYALDHLDWRERVDALASREPNLHLAGNHLEGISLNDTIGLSERLARAIHQAHDAARAA